MLTEELIDESAHGEYFEVLHILIPRYLRIIGDGSKSKRAEAFSKLSEKLGKNSNLLQRVKWFKSACFISLPGYVSINDLDPLSCGFFSFDIASACAVNALGMGSARNSMNILDLCCCPGGKMQMMYDILEHNTLLSRQIDDNSEYSNTSKDEFSGEIKDKVEKSAGGSMIVGVDISMSRLKVCTSLLDQTARYKVSKRYNDQLIAKQEKVDVNNNSFNDQSKIDSRNESKVMEKSKNVKYSDKFEKNMKEKSLNNKKSPPDPRLLLFNCDGTNFRLNSFGTLVFDSKLQDEELFFLFEKEKRGNEFKQINDKNKENKKKIDSDKNLKFQTDKKSQLDYQTKVGNNEKEERFFVAEENDKNSMIPNNNLRKRKNKSARQREKKRLKLIEIGDLSVLFNKNDAITLNYVENYDKNDDNDDDNNNNNHSISNYNNDISNIHIDHNRNNDNINCNNNNNNNNNDNNNNNNNSLIHDSNQIDNLSINIENLTKNTITKLKQKLEIPIGEEKRGSKEVEEDNGFFDFVLVDAECSHDGSYRHMRYVSGVCHEDDENDESDEGYDNDNENKNEYEKKEKKEMKNKKENEDQIDGDEEEEGKMKMTMEIDRKCIEKEEKCKGWEIEEKREHDLNSQNNTHNNTDNNTHNTQSPLKNFKPNATKSFSHSYKRIERNNIVELQKKLLSNGFLLLKRSSYPINCEDAYSSSTAASTSTSIATYPSTSTSTSISSALPTSSTTLYPTLVYSTCSLEVSQNEGVVKWFLSTHSDAELVPLSPQDLCGVSPQDLCGVSDDVGGRRGEGNDEEDVASGMFRANGEERRNEEKEINHNKVESIINHNMIANHNKHDILDNTVHTNVNNSKKNTNICDSQTLDLQFALNLLSLDPPSLLEAVKELGGLTAAKDRLRHYSRLINKHFADQCVFPLSSFSSSSSSSMKMSNNDNNDRNINNSNSNTYDGIVIDVRNDCDDDRDNDNITRSISGNNCVSQGHDLSQTEQSLRAEHSSVSPKESSLSLIPGTIRLSKKNGTSGIFIAKFRKKIKTTVF